MIDKINNELIKLQNELSSLSSAVSKINDAEKLSTEIVKAVQDLHLKYKQSFENIDKETKQYFKDNVNETKKIVSDIIIDLNKYSEQAKNTLTELNTKIENSDAEKSKNIENVINSHASQVEKVDALLQNYLDLADSTAKLTQKIDKIDFAGNFDKIYANMAELNIEIRTVKEIAVDNAKSETVAQLQKSLKKNNVKTNITLFIAFITLAAIIVMAFQFAAVKYFPEYDFIKEYIENTKE